MLGKNLLWVAKRHGHSVEVMLRMYAAWLEGATDSDIHAIKQAMQIRPVRMPPDARAAISPVNAAKNRLKQIVIRPPKSPEFGRSLAVGNGERSKPLNRKQIRWRRAWDYSALRASPLRGRPSGRYPRFVAVAVD